MDKVIRYPELTELMAIIAKTKFEDFNKNDWYTFAGCQSDKPLIGEYGDFTIVIDGSMVNVVNWENTEGGGRLYSLAEI
jgi:hypothetical protein